jgi:hypothetical protein
MHNLSERKKIIMTLTLYFAKEKIIESSNCDSIADQGAPRRIRKPYGWETIEKLRSPPSEQAMNSA